MKIGILDQTCAGWSGGASYTRALLASLAVAESARQPDDASTARDEIVFLARDEKIDVPEQFEKIPFASLAKRRDFDVVLPVRDKAVREIDPVKVGWIPDFQHCRLPELFTLHDLASRDALFDLIGRECQLVVVSSESSRRDFQKFLPPYAGKVRVLPFPSTLWASPLGDNPQSVIARYHLPSKFALVANQFWRHKNHALLPPVISLLKDRGVSISLVLTGMPADYRDVENRGLSEFFQTCARLGISDQIHFLGHVPYSELIALIRCAALVIQPSLFEGWNTTVEDAKALGRPLVCSDIPVHREQAASALGFFQTASPENLASLLADFYPHLEAGPAPSTEDDALRRSKAQSAQFGQALLSVAREAFRFAHPGKPRPATPTVASISVSTEKRSKASRIQKYLGQKRGHLQYIIGKIVFKLTWWHRNISVSQMKLALYRFTVSLHGHELGILRQYPARPFRAEKFPTRRKNPRPGPQISIVTPTFNQGQTLDATIKSVVEQNYSQIQYAVVDGGSQDNTCDILKKHAATLAYCVSEPDDGQAHAIVKGFAALQGDIMAYLNSDDILMPGTLSYVADYFSGHRDVDVLYGHRIIIDEQAQEVGRWILPRHDTEAVRHFDYVPQETLFWRRSIYEKVGGINPAFHFAMDWDLLLRFMQAGARIRRVPYFLACFRTHTRQKTHTMFDTVGEREKLHLLAREHPDGFNVQSVQQLQDRYRYRSSVCAALLNFGLRY